MLNNNQSGNTNHSLVILHATLNVCGKSAGDLARQQTAGFFSPSFSAFFFFLWFFYIFHFCFLFASAPTAKLQRHSFAGGSSAKTTTTTTSKTTTTTTTTMASN